jgi:hypothetical protein
VADQEDCDASACTKPASGAGFTSMQEAAVFLGVPEIDLEAPVASANGTQHHWSDKLPDELWQPCSHTFCKLQARSCSSLPAYQQSTCSKLKAIRVYHNGRENAGRAHRCHVTNGECACMCAHEHTLDRLGDMFSGRIRAAKSQCPNPKVWAAGMKCSGSVLADNPKSLSPPQIENAYKHNRLAGIGVHKDDAETPHLCQNTCEDLGALCVRFNMTSGACRCFDGAAVEDTQPHPASDEIEAGCSTNDAMSHVRDLKAALHWYKLSSRYGSKWGEKRVQEIEARNKEDEQGRRLAMTAILRGGNESI